MCRNCNDSVEFVENHTTVNTTAVKALFKEHGITVEDQFEFFAGYGVTDTFPAFEVLQFMGY